MKNGLGKSLSLFILPPIFAWFIRLWFATCRQRIHGEQHIRQAEKSSVPFIGTCWHYCVMGIFPFYRKKSLVVMVSSSNDGDYLSRMAQTLGFGIVRGSRNKRGALAAKELIKQLKKGKNVGLVADGSQGPPKIVQAGSILLASRTGAAILPWLWSGGSYFTFKSWDRLILPKPFSRMDIFIGEPLFVPKGIDAAEMEEYRLLLEKKLNELYDTAWQLQGKKEH